MAMDKLSKSSGPPVFTKAQVFKVGGKWLYSCQEGCYIKHVPNASFELAFKIAHSHMAKTHKDGRYRRSLINGR